ncbi:AraC family transcriptional regulator [Streptomyces chumphonensis]|uniref:AraC family transcriptional regulator n=1 Tax=Streptomyces chumphonensis TaxID=1214925 RepID=UPI0029650891|nr:AraC family transcriptional regulator ligand-binding domain-containing protein [Streptomyces chumphonensis]
MTRSVSVHHVRAVLHGAERRSLPTEPLLRRAGIAPETLDDDRARVSPAQFTLLVQALWTALDDELLGFGPIPFKVGTFAMMCRVVVYGGVRGGHDLRAALRRCREFYDLFPAGPRLRPVETGGAEDEAAVEFDLADCDGPAHFGSEATTVIGHRFAGWLLRRRIALRRAEFAYPAPAHAAEYALLFGAPCVFDAPRTAIVFDRALLDEPVLQDAEGLRTFLRRAPVDVLARLDYAATVSARVRRLLGQALPGPLPTPEQIAARLSVSPQTLRRQLAAEGTSFQQVRDRLRRDHAIAALASGRVSIEALSRQLGFSEPSAFHRAFRRWTGATPRSYRLGPGQRN